MSSTGQGGSDEGARAATQDPKAVKLDPKLADAKKDLKRLRG